MKKKTFVLIIFVLIITVCGCGKKEVIDGAQMSVYYINNDASKISAVEFISITEDTKEAVRAAMEKIALNPDSVEYVTPISGFEVISYIYDNEQVVIDVDRKYKTLDMAKEVLARAAIVKTLTQIPGVSYVSFQVEGMPLKDNLDNVVGAMKADNFIDSKDISSYEKTYMNLYFSNAEGDGLVETSREVVYNINIPIERTVVEQLIKGIDDENAFPVINPETKIISVSIMDGVCYVNLDAAFLNQTYQVKPEVVIYSIVNSLVELGNVNKVQIQVDGNLDFIQLESVSLLNMLREFING